MVMLSDEDKSPARIRLRNHFYYDIARAKREYNTYRVLKATPYGNTLVRTLAEKLIDEERLGEDNDPDLLAVNFLVWIICIVIFPLTRRKRKIC